MKGHSNGPVELRDLMESRVLSDLSLLHASSRTSRVEDLALITDIEEITAVRPDTVIVLTDRVAKGGWTISAVLRYAWERRASALIVPEQSVTEIAVELARRLDVSLLSTNRDATRLALDVALQIGMARAGSIARVQVFSERVSQAHSLTDALELVSRELGSSRVSVEASGAIAIEVPAAEVEQARRDNEGDGALVVVPIFASKANQESLTTQVLEHEREFAEQVLTAAAPVVRALLTESRLHSMRQSLPQITVTALTGLRDVGLIDDPSWESAIADLHWPINGLYTAVCILTKNRERLGTAVHQIWQSSFQNVPLAPIADGWVTFMPIAENDAQSHVIVEMRKKLAAVSGLGLMVGVSTQYSGAANSVIAVREAWLAARMAGGGRSPACDAGDAAANTLVDFANVSLLLLKRLVPGELAERLAASLFPRLIADAAVDEIIEAVVIYLASRGSVSHAAKILGVHRNTMQSRIRRAEELGVPLNNADEVLAVHMLLAAIAQSRG